MDEQDISQRDLRAELEERLDRDALLALCREAGMDDAATQSLDKSGLIEALLSRGSLEGLIESIVTHGPGGVAAPGDQPAARPPAATPISDPGQGIDIGKEDLKRELVGYWDAPSLQEIARKFFVEVPGTATVDEVADKLLEGLSVRVLLGELMEREASREAAGAQAPAPSAAPGGSADSVQQMRSLLAGTGVPPAAATTPPPADDGDVLRQMRSLRTAPPAPEPPAEPPPEPAPEPAPEPEPPLSSEQVGVTAAESDALLAQLVRGPEDGAARPAADAAVADDAATPRITTGTPAAKPEDDLDVLRQMRSLRSELSSAGAAKDGTSASGSAKPDRKFGPQALLVTGALAAVLVFGVFPRLLPMLGSLLGRNPTGQPTPAPSPAPAATPSAAGTPVTTLAVLPTPTPTSVATSVPTPVVVPVATATPGLVATPTASPTAVAALRPTPTPTPTLPPPTPTPTALALVTPTPVRFDLPRVEDMSGPTVELYERLSDILADPDMPSAVPDVARKLKWSAGEAEAVGGYMEEAPPAGSPSWAEGVRLLAQGSYAKAETKLRAVLFSVPRGPQRARMFLLLAKARAGLKTYAPALDTYRKALEEEPASEAAAMGVCRMYQSLGMAAPAVTFAQGFVAVHPSARLQALLPGQPAPTAAPTAEATPVPAATPVPTPVVALAETPVPTEQPTPPEPTATEQPTPTAAVAAKVTAASLAAEAEAAERAGSHDQAGRLYEEALACADMDLDPARLATVHRKVGDYYMENGEPARALAFYLESDSPDRCSPDRALIMADVAREAGDDGAAERYDAAAAKAPARDAAALMQAAQAHERAHEYLPAAELYRRVTSMASAPKELRATAHLNLAFCLRVLKRFDQALAEAEKAEQLGKKVEPGFKILLNLRR